jgi:hypothetical protein
MKRAAIFAMSIACAASIVGCGGEEGTQPLEEVTSALTGTPTITIGTSTSDTGFIRGSIGSMSPTTTSNGFTYSALVDHYTIKGDFGNSHFSVSGFTSNPGAGWLTSVKVGSASAHTGATALYSYLGGQATWTWRGIEWGFVGHSETCTIIHN